MDVNVHPAKMEVRFTNEEDVYNLFFKAISDALQSISLIPDVSLSRDSNPPGPEKKTAEISAEKKGPEPFEHVRAANRKAAKDRAEASAGAVAPPPVPRAAYPKEVHESESYSFQQIGMEVEESGQTPRFHIIGQVFSTYWLIEYDMQLLIIDQHAAHEKVLYEKLMRHLSEKEGLTQNLAAPVVISLTDREAAVLQEHMDYFARLGFRVEHFGEKDYLITGVPADFLNIASKDLFMDILDGLSGGSGRTGQPEAALERCASMACKAAVKGNHSMSYEEAERLIGQMLQMEQPYHCPHGRPTAIAISKQEFEKKFKRIV